MKKNRLIRWGLLSLVTLLLSLLFLSQLSLIQQTFAQKMVHWLSTQLRTEVKLDHFRWKNFRWLEVNGLLIKDLQADTLLAVEHLALRFSPLLLFSHKLMVDELEIANAFVNIRRDTTQKWNYEFVFNAFSTSTKDTSSPATHWIVKPNMIQAQRIRIEYSDLMVTKQFSAKFEEINAKVEVLSLDQQNLALNYLSFKQPSIKYVAGGQLKEWGRTANKSPSFFAFPDLGWNIQIERTQLDEGQLIYRKSSQRKIVGPVFNSSDLALQSIHWDIQQLNIDSAQIEASIKSLSVLDHSGFQITQCHADIILNNHLASLQNFQLKTPTSRIQYSLAVQYPAWEALEVVFGSSLKYKAEEIGLNFTLMDLSITPEDIKRFLPNALPTVSSESFNLTGAISGTLAQINVENLKGYQGPKLRLAIKGLLSGLPALDKLNVDLSIDALEADYLHLNPLLPINLLPKGLAQWRSVKINGKLNGRISDFALKHLHIKAQNGPEFQGSIQVAGLKDFQTTQIHLQLDSFITSAHDWAVFISDTIPPLLENMGEMAINGSFDGTLHEFETIFELKTKTSRFVANSQFSFNQDYSDASYQGQFNLQGFNAAKLVGDSLLGKMNLNLVLRGKGLQASNWDVDIEAICSEIHYNQYQYDSLLLSGRLEAGSFIGDISMKDPNLTFDLNGDWSLIDSLPKYTFSLQLDTFNLKPLGLHAKPLSLSTGVRADIRNHHMDNLEGELTFTHLILRDSVHEFLTENISLLASLSEKNIQQLTLSSDWLKMGLEGKYQLSQLPREIADWIDQDFPIHDILFPLDSIEVNEQSEDSHFPNPDTNIKAYLHVGNPLALTNILLPELKKLDTLDFSLEFDKTKAHWNIDLTMPSLQYAEFQLDSLSYESDYEDNRVSNLLTASLFKFGENTIIPRPVFKATLKDDDLNFKVLSSETKDSVLWEMGGELTTTGHQIHLQLDRQIRLNGQDWHIDSTYQLFYDRNGSWEINHLQLAKGHESILLEGQQKVNQSNHFSLTFQEFEINALLPLLDYPSSFMTGTLSGQVEARNALTNLSFLANLELKNWMIDSVLIGDANLHAQQTDDQSVIDILATLKEQQSDLTLAGTYDSRDELFDVKANINHWKMQNMDPFLSELIHDSEGYVSGQIRLKGNPRQPELNGSLQLHQVKTTVDYVNIPYHITAGEITFTEQEIDFGEIQMIDLNDQKATLSGVVHHYFFDQLDMDLHFKTDRFQFLNTSQKDNKLFYGQLLLRSDITLKGSPSQPHFSINAETQAGTQLNIVPLINESNPYEDDFIIFGQSALDQLGNDTTFLNHVPLTSSGLELQLNLLASPDATLKIIVDPLSGDNLTCKGMANLTVGINPTGNTSVIGNYQITEGEYVFSYEQLLKRKFTISPNSKISFNGDPLLAKLDITATYHTKVLLSDLVQDQLIDKQLVHAKTRVDVELQLKISGDLLHPLLSFDIVLVGNPQGAIADAARTRLIQLRNDETALNTQVFGLLLFNSFINSNNVKQSVINTGETVLLSSVSKLISNELNRLASGIFKGVDLNLGIDAYKPGIDPVGNASIATEVQLGISKSLLNDRLNVKVGGNLNLGSGQQEQSSLTTIAGDFALEYQLTANGNYLLRVYQRSDYDALYEGNLNKTGAGFSIRKTFKNKGLKRRK